MRRGRGDTGIWGRMTGGGRSGERERSGEHSRREDVPRVNDFLRREGSLLRWGGVQLGMRRIERGGDITNGGRRPASFRGSGGR